MTVILRFSPRPRPPPLFCLARLRARLARPVLYVDHARLVGLAGARRGGAVVRYDAVVFAMQQPFAQLIWRADLAVLYDTQGGILVQPAVRWKRLQR